MRALTGSIALRGAGNAGRIARADTGSGNSCVKLYSSSGGTLLAIRRLAKPCGTVSAAGRLVLLPHAEDDLVLATGAANHAEWCDADGNVLSADPVTDENGMQSDGVGGLIDSGNVGPWVLGGTSAGTMIYEGGIVALHTAVIG